MSHSRIAVLRTAAVVVALVCMASGCSSPDAPRSVQASRAALPPDFDAGEVRLSATLTGAAISGVVPKGSAEFDVGARAVTFSASAADVNLPNGTLLRVFVDIVGVGKVSMGTMKLRLVGGAPGNASLTVRKAVPTMHAGDVVTVETATAVILQGAF